MNSGLPYAALAFVAWGLYPLYFLKIASVPPLEVVLQRSVWSLVFVLVLLALLRRWDWLRPLAAQPRRLGLFALSALLLSVNWLVYVWAVQNGHVIEASLGYFINPVFVRELQDPDVNGVVEGCRTRCLPRRLGIDLASQTLKLGVGGLLCIFVRPTHQSSGAGA